MRKLKFEYRITLVYLVIGILWILFSDQLLTFAIHDIDVLTTFQTLKGWFYVLITALLLFLFLKKHLNRLRTTEKELEKHQYNLEQLVREKTQELDIAIAELSSTNAELSVKNEIINKQYAELKETMHHLRETQGQLIQSEKMASIGILTAGVSHEINNPLNYILGGFTGLENYFREEGTHNPRIALFLDSIKTGVERVNAIVSGLGQLSSTKTGLNDACDLHRILENCLNMVDYLFKNRITVHRDLIPEQVFIRGNSGKLHQVFINILLNASQSISGDGSISILSRRVPDGVLICIADSGCGIEPENLPRITDPFYTTREPGKGTGLGLSIAYSIIREHKGDIQFSSEPGKGTRVDITLPVYNEQIR